MSDSENIYQLWKQRAEIDYIPPFMALWLALNAWMKDSSELSPDRTDRARLEELKRSDSVLSGRFAELIGARSIDGTLFRGYLGELHQTLVKARISYDKSPQQIISFDCCMIERTKGKPRFASLVAQNIDSTPESEQQEIILDEELWVKLDEELWVENNPERLFAAYIEIVYQIRCALFHGNLAPDTGNKQVIQQLYLTLSMIMEDV